MNCGNLCQCQLSWPVDTLGLKRDPVSSEKGWLDFAVRLLSREVVGKGRGQELVWNDKCKPDWWDRDVGVAWKNPTSNPKDTKEVLQKKFSALHEHLNAEGRFPKELEEEARLWNAGQVKELFLQTTLISLLGKVSSLHVAMDDACKQVKEMKALVNTDMVNNIKSCLGETLRATENLILTKSVAAKRQGSPAGKENKVTGPPKSRKVESVHVVAPKTAPVNVAVSCSSSQNVATHCNSSQNTNVILALAQKIMDKRRKRESCLTVKSVKKIFPKPTLLPLSDSVHTVSPLEVPVIVGVSPLEVPVVVGVSPGGLTYVLNTNNASLTHSSNMPTKSSLLAPLKVPIASNLFIKRIQPTPPSSISASSIGTLWGSPNSTIPISSDTVLSSSPPASSDSVFTASSVSPSILSSHQFSSDLLLSASPDSTSPSSSIAPETGHNLWLSPNSTFNPPSPPASNESGFISRPLSAGSLSFDSTGSATSPHFDDRCSVDFFLDQNTCPVAPLLDDLSPFSIPDKTMDLSEPKDQESVFENFDLDLNNPLWEEDGSAFLINFLQDV